MYVCILEPHLSLIQQRNAQSATKFCFLNCPFFIVHMACSISTSLQLQLTGQKFSQSFRHHGLPKELCSLTPRFLRCFDGDKPRCGHIALHLQTHSTGGHQGG